jgi:hypothetical protein
MIVPASFWVTCDSDPLDHQCGSHFDRRDGLPDQRRRPYVSDSSQMNGMSEAQMQRHRLLIIPGGNFEEIGNSLTARAAANIRGPVRSGVNYLGISAGAFFAGNSPYNRLNLTSGARYPKGGGCDYCDRRTPAETDNAYAAMLIRAAMNRESMPHY